MKLSELKTADQLQFELIKQGWRKSFNDKPWSEEAELPHFHVTGRDAPYGSAVSLYLPELPTHGNYIGIAADLTRDGEIYEWSVFSHYSGIIEEVMVTDSLELNSIEIGGFLLDWINSQLKEELGR